VSAFARLPSISPVRSVLPGWGCRSWLPGSPGPNRARETRFPDGRVLGFGRSRCDHLAAGLRDHRPISGSWTRLPRRV